jgi:murein DD-endopeptidase MepM/ murein hydrolase activator NlpD
VTIRFQKNGVYQNVTFGHLQKDSWPPNGSTVSAGDVIGIQGLSGNLDRAIRQGATNDVHSHIIVRKRTGTGWHPENDFEEIINPEQFIKTKFDANGSPLAETDC